MAGELTVKATLNGVAHTLTYNSSTGAYMATVSAPGATSFHQTGGYYSLSVAATNAAGTTGTADGATLEGLRLVVQERVKPIITIISPTDGAHITNAKQRVIANIIDEVGGSGIDLNTLKIKQDGVIVASENITTSGINNGYKVIYATDTVRSDGAHTVEISVSDNDGNAAESVLTTFTVDTVPPIIDMLAPPEGLITNKPELDVSVKTNDANSTPVTVNVLLNGADQGPVSLSSEGLGSKRVTIIDGKNTITATATDAAGNQSSITRTVTLDTRVPVIKSATITPNPVDAGATVLISVVIEQQ